MQYTTKYLNRLQRLTKQVGTNYCAVVCGFIQRCKKILPLCIGTNASSSSMKTISRRKKYFVTAKHLSYCGFASVLLLVLDHTLSLDIVEWHLILWLRILNKKEGQLAVTLILFDRASSKKTKGKDRLWVLQHCCLEAYFTLTRISSFIHLQRRCTHKEAWETSASEGRNYTCNLASNP